MEPSPIHSARKRRRERACLCVCVRTTADESAGGAARVDYVTWHGVKTCASILHYRWGGRKGEGGQRREDYGVACFGLGMGDEGIGEIWAPPHTFLLYHTLWGGGEGKKGGWVGLWMGL